MKYVFKIFFHNFGEIMNVYTMSVSGACKLLSFYDRSQVGDVCYMTKREEIDHQVLIDNAFINKVCEEDGLVGYILTIVGHCAVIESLKTMNNFKGY